MHDLIRLYTIDTAEDVQRAALGRVLDFYTHTAHTAQRLLNPHCFLPIQLDPPVPGVRLQPLSDAAAALAWFDTEHPTLLAAQHTAASHALHPTVWQMAWTLETFHYWRGRRHNRLTTWRAALDAAMYLPDPVSRTYAHRRLGWAYADLGYHQQGIERLGHAIALAEENDDTVQLARTHRRLALA